MNISISISRLFIFAILTGALTFSSRGYCFGFSIDFDAATGNFIITYESEDLGREVQVIFEPPTKVEPSATPTIVSAQNGFIYSYAIKNASTAVQPIVSFKLSLSSDPITVASPPNWTTLGPNTRSQTLSWIPEVEGINPGSELGGYTVQSELLPGITTLRFRGGAAPLGYPDEPPEDVGLAVLEIRRNSKNSFVELSRVGPVDSSVGLTDDALVQRLIDLKENQFAVGGIFGPGAKGIERSLDAKLDAAKKSISKGKNKTAKNQLNAFINELEAQRDKHLTNNAFFLLKVNAEFLISKLGP